MTKTLTEIYEDLVHKYPAPRVTTLDAGASDVVEEVREPAFLTESTKGRVIITTAVRQKASTNQGFLYLHGRFVEADAPNRNGAYWSSQDLELGAPTVAGGPLNWLHDDKQIIGTLLDGELVHARESSAASGLVNNHIVSTAAVWKFLFPEQASIVEKASEDRNLFYSMECVSQNVQCVDRGSYQGCQEIFPYRDYLSDKSKVCAHLRESASAKRFIEPVFLGGAVIVPPIKPGWANAEASVVRQAAAATEDNPFEEVDKAVATEMVAAILTWANTSR